MFRKLLALAAVFTLAFAGSAAIAAPPEPDDLKTARYVIEFVDRADLDTIRRISDRTDRGRAVVDELRQTAGTSQAPARQILDAAGVEYEAFWMRNVVVGTLDADTIAQLSALPGIASIRPERAYEMLQPVESSEAVFAASGDPEWGVAQIGADAVWDQGITGAGVVVGSLDSGVQFDHPALVNSYRGNNGDGTFDHNYNWFDAVGGCPVGIPCDTFGHGTHTMGTILGGDGPGPFTPDIGVAPGATWMLASCGSSFCSESQLMSVGEWFLEPTDLNGQNPDITKRPHVINNSWGGGPGDPFFLDMVSAWRAAGIIPVFASGNPGPACGAGGSPGDYLDAFSVGATDINDVIADFSGRGPSAYGKVNPDVSAPGVNVVSSLPGSTYGANSGTSMATPHVVGALALVMSSDISLINDVDAATEIMRQTAFDIIDLSCGGDADGDPNNVYGDGRIDAAAAVAVAATGGTLTGTVTASDTGDPVAGAKVSATGGPFDASGTTAADGTYKMFLAAGTYDISVSAFAYLDAAAADVEIVVDETTTQDFSLDLAPSSVVSGYVTALESGNAIANATVTALGVPVAGVTTDADGFYSLTLPHGSYTLEARLGGCMVPESATVVVDDDVQHDFALLTKIDNWGHGCSPTAYDWVPGTQQIKFGRSGDDVLRTRQLPFKVDFYGKRFQTMYVGSNGHVGFLDPQFSNFFNTPIPDPNVPNAAIYPMWQDWIVDADASVWWTVQRSDEGRAIVVEYRDVVVFGGSARATFELKIWENGVIDLLYADTDEVGAGAQATIGIENGFGTDALQLGYREPVAASGSAWRISRVPTGRVMGLVTNANDGLPVVGATISADPTGRSTKTGTDGTYSLTLVPSSYTITASAENYVSESTGVLVAGGRATANFVLDAASASIDPDSLSSTVDFGDTDTATVTVSNVGTADLAWELFEQQLSATPPVFDQAELLAMRGDVAYKALQRPTTKSIVGEYSFDGPLVTIIDDPDDDTIGTSEITMVRAGVAGGEVAIAIDYSDATPISQTIGLVYLDTDQDPDTGLPPEVLSGLPSQDIGFDYFVELFAIHDSVPLVAVWTADFEFVGEAPAAVEGQTISFAIPLEFFGDEDGSMDIALDTGVIGPEDWAPDAGHGTIDPFGDVPWIVSEPSSGTLAPGDSVDVEVTLGSADTLPGAYEGLLAMLSNDPRATRRDIAVSLEVLAPEAFGALAGTVTNSVTGDSIEGAIVSMTTVWDGAALDLSAVTDASGSYHLVGPEGTWPAGVTASGYLDFEGDLTIVAGSESTHDIALVPDVALLSLSPDALFLTVASGGTAEAVVTIGNDGTQPLEWLINENLTAAEVAATKQLTGVTWERQDGWAGWDRPEGYTANPIEVGYTATSVVITDPTGDAIGSIDVTTVEAGVDGATVSMRIDTAVGSPVGDAVGFVYLDTDQDPATGLPAGDLDGLPEQDIGMEYFLDLFLVPDAGIALLVSTETFEVVAELPVTIDGQAMIIDVPLDVLGAGEDGTINIAMVIGDFSGPHDWAPDVGHGEIIPFEDIPWLTLSESSGVVDPGDSVDVIVSVDSAGLEPGTYSGELLVSSNDPTVGTISVPVTLTVE